MNQQSLRDKIAGLLAKAERTDNEHERDAFNAKAESLMLKYGIEQAELESRGEVKPEDIVEERIVFKGIYAVIMPTFVNSVATAMGGLSVLQSSGHNTKVAYIIGHRSDVDRMMLLVNSLQVQALTAMKRWWKSYDDKQWMSNMEQYKARRQFISSFGRGAADRIKSERRQEEAEVSTGAALVLVSKQERVDQWTQDKYKPKTNNRGGAHGSYAGSAEGRAAGRQANVGTTSLGGSRGALNG